MVLGHALRRARELAPAAAAVLLPSLFGAVSNSSPIWAQGAARDGSAIPCPPWALADPAASWARAVAEASAAHPLRAHLLPALEASAAGPELWLHAADAAIAFDRGLAAMCGSRGGGLDAEGGRGTCCCCCARVLAERAEWARAWWDAELAHWLREVDAAMDMPGAWEPGRSVDVDEEEGAGGNARATGLAGGGARPPECARAVAQLVRAAASRGCQLGPRARRAFLAAVPRRLASDFAGRLERRVAAPASGGALSTPAGIAKAGGCIVAARALSRALASLGESPQLLSCLPPAAQVSGAAGGAFAPEVLSLAALEAEMCGTLVAALEEGAVRLLAPYVSGRAAFAAAGGPGTPHAGPSPSLGLALDWLQGTCRLLAASLDRVGSSRVRASLASRINRHLFNEVLTEATFSVGGGRQLAEDVRALGAVLGGCALPHLVAGSAILSLDDDEAAELEEALEAHAGKWPGEAEALSRGGDGQRDGVYNRLRTSCSILSSEAVLTLLALRIGF